MSMPGFTGEVSLYKTGTHYHMVATEVRSTSQVMASMLYVTGPLSKWWFTCTDVLNWCKYYRCASLNDTTNEIKCRTCCDKMFDACLYTGIANWGIYWPFDLPPCDEPPYTFSGA
jgi:hypothetical protein